MSLLDDAIRQHLDLKRKHGASEDELRQLEDQAFGGTSRPGDEEATGESAIFDESAEAPTQFLGEAATEAPADVGAEPAAEETSLLPSEPPPAAEEPDPEPVDEAPPPPVAGEGGDDPFEIPPYRVGDDADADEPSAMEHELAPPADEESSEPPAAATADAPPEAVSDESGFPDEPGALSQEAREEIASQPTELYDFESEEGVDTAAADSAAIDESNFEEETGEETFFDEQSLSDELDQALDVPAGSGAAPAISPAADEEDDEDEFAAEEDLAPTPPPPPPPPPPEPVDDEAEDLLEETPDFLQETPENERLWFEQKPPKDFDFDD